jgi:hypothetical protein
MASNSKNPGGGTGGDESSQDHAQFFDGRFRVAANQIELLSCPPTPAATPLPETISLVATDLTGMEGQVTLRGAKGIRVTTGPPMLPPAASDSTNGVEVIVSESQNVTIQRGLLPGVDQKIEMTPGNITVDGGAGTITIQSLTQITLSVAGGLSTITLTPAGITIQGVLVQIN